MGDDVSLKEKQKGKIDGWKILLENCLHILVFFKTSQYQSILALKCFSSTTINKTPPIKQHKLQEFPQTKVKYKRESFSLKSEVRTQVLLEIN